MVDPVIPGAIFAFLTKIVLFGFCVEINEIRHQHVVGNCIVPIPGTNYVIKFSKYAIPTLCYTVTGNNGDITYHNIGTITWPGTHIPNPKKIVVVQPCPGIYNTHDLYGVLADLKGVSTKDHQEPNEFIKPVMHILKGIGYVSLQNTETNTSPSAIMNQLKTLFDQQNVEHATNHMKQIFDLMHQLEGAVV